MKSNKTNATATTTPIADMSIRTKHLASKFGIKATALRRVLRSMPAYADGVHTNYRWAANDKAAFDAIEARIKAAAADKQAKAKTAKAALDARASALAKA